MVPGRGDVQDAKPLEGLLHYLRLEEWKIRLEDAIKATDQATIGGHDHIVGPSINRRERGKGPTTGTTDRLRVEPDTVSYDVTNQWHVSVQQAGRNEPTNLA